jgi:hypothetical protein
MCFIGYQEGEKVLYVFSQNWKAEEEEVNTYYNTWSSFWKEKNAKSEKFMVEDPNLC